VKTKLDIDDCSEWIRVERDPTLCELHNGDVNILCGWPNLKKKSCVLMSLIIIYFMFLFKIYSCLELDLILDLNTRVYVDSSCFRYFSILSGLLIINLSRSRRIILTHDLLFRCTNFFMTRHIRP
jgi:hypothetical protein